MQVKQFQAETKKLLDLMIHSIYTHKEIFLRELISNASDAIDKSYYYALTNDNVTFNKEDFFIKIVPDKDTRTLTITDTGVGMSKEDLENNLGIIAKSGSLEFKNQHESKDGVDIIGQFGVGFYSAFMVSDLVTVISKTANGSANKWESEGADGYAVESCEKENVGTEIILQIKPNTDDENYDLFLDEYHLKSLIKKYSDFIKYPIKMMLSDVQSEDKEAKREEIINSMVPIWQKNKKELSKEDYDNFYAEKHYGFDKPLKTIHSSVDGVTSYNTIMFIPSNAPFDFYTKDYEKGLELYSNGVLIMQKCSDLLPDFFSFVKGLVDSPDLSLNISRELLQHNNQLKFIAKKIKDKIKSELISLLHNDREKYEEFFNSFGRQLKFGVYNDWGANKDVLQDLLLFYSSSEKKMVTLDEYVTRMKDDQKFIYYIKGESIGRIEKMPQTEMVLDSGHEILYLTDDVDEFAIRMLGAYKEKSFKSVSGGNLEIDENREENIPAENKEVFSFMKEILKDKVKDVRVSKRLKTHPVCLISDGDLSIEMEKVLSSMPNSVNPKAEKVLEINPNHEIYNVIKSCYENDKDKLRKYTEILYNQALLIEGLAIDNPLDFATSICELMK